MKQTTELVKRKFLKRGSRHFINVVRMHVDFKLVVFLEHFPTLVTGNQFDLDLHQSSALKQLFLFPGTGIIDIKIL